MTQKKDVATQGSKVMKESTEQEYVVRPAVDIFEDESGLTVQADMPGVSREQLDVQIDSDSLSIVGKVKIAVPKNMDALYADFRSTRYERNFSLSRELDGDNVEANLKDGILTLRIPKREQFTPRKIEVRTS